MEEGAAAVAAGGFVGIRAGAAARAGGEAFAQCVGGVTRVVRLRLPGGLAGVIEGADECNQARDGDQHADGAEAEGDDGGGAH